MPFTPGTITINGLNLGTTELGYALRSGSATPIPVTWSLGNASPDNPGAGWVAIAAAPAASGFSLYWKQSGSNLYGLWNLSSSGALVSAGSGLLTEDQFLAEEARLNTDLNSDGLIGLTFTPIRTLNGLTLGLTNRGYALRSGSAAPIPVTWNFGNTSPDNPGAGWAAIAAAPSAGGFSLYWKHSGSNLYGVWNLNSSGALVSLGSALLSEDQFLAEETRLNADLNSDGAIGLTFSPIRTLNGLTLGLTNRGYALRSGTAAPLLVTPSLGTASPDDPGAGWAAIAAAPSANGFALFWKQSSSNLYGLWNLNSSGALVSLGSALLSEDQFLAEEARLNADLNGDGSIWLASTPIRTLNGLTLSLTSRGYALRSAAAAPVLVTWSLGNASPDNPGAGWAAIAAAPTASGFSLYWKQSGSNQYAIWNLNSSGALVSLGSALLSADQLLAEEARLNADLNGDGAIGPAAINLVRVTAVSADRPEGNSGFTPFTYTISRSGNVSAGATLSWNVAGSGATPANAADFGGTLPSGTISFLAGQTSQSLTINVSGDTSVEADETFSVTLSNPSGTNLDPAASTTTATIRNDDAAPPPPPPTPWLDLYNPTLGTLPNAQNSLAFFTLGGSQSLSTNGTNLQTSAIGTNAVAGYSNYFFSSPATLVNPAFPRLDRSKGFALNFNLRILSETHNTANRAGFSVTLLDQPIAPASDPMGIELGFWSNQIFSQAGGSNPFSAANERSITRDNTQLTSYSLQIFDQSYSLLANNNLVLSGALQSYSQSVKDPALPFNPYITPNFLFLGDNTRSASAAVELGATSLLLQDSYTTPMLRDVPGGSNLRISSLLTVGERVPGNNGVPYIPPGRLDGMGAYDNGDGTITLLVNHELAATDGYPMNVQGLNANVTGARISRFVIAKDMDRNPANGYQARVLSGGLAYDEVRSVDSTFAKTGFTRFCSASLSEPSQFGSGRGFVDRLYFMGEESGEGRFFALDTANRDLHHVPALGRGGWESAVAVDTGSANTVALMLFDDTGGTANYLYLWVGTKAPGSTDLLRRNGIDATSGSLYAWKAESLNNQVGLNAVALNTAVAGHWERLGSGTEIAALTSASQLRSLAQAKEAMAFIRIEDGDVSPSTGKQVAFNTTGGSGADLYGNTNIIDLGTAFTDEGILRTTANTSSLRVIVDSDRLTGLARQGSVRNPDNMAWSRNGKLYIQEDRIVPGGTADGQFGSQETSIWEVDPLTGGTQRWAQVDRGAVPTVYGQTDSQPADIGNWESSGITEVSSLFGAPAGSVFLSTVLAHSITNGSIAGNANLVEGSQIQLIQVVS